MDIFVIWCFSSVARERITKQFTFMPLKFESQTVRTSTDQEVIWTSEAHLYIQLFFKLNFYSVLGTVLGTVDTPSNKVFEIRGNTHTHTHKTQKNSL